MQGSFEYFFQPTPTNDITIENTGNCVIKAFNDDAATFYLWIKTSEFGLTKIIEFGPYVEDLLYELKNFKISYKKINYSESKITKAIDTFLNNPNYQITQAFESVEEEIKPLLENIDLVTFMEG